MGTSPSLPPLFEFSGGNLALDFVNTWGDRGRPDTDKLGSFQRVVDFAREAGLLDAGRARAFAGAARRDPAAAVEALGTARRFRESLYALFASNSLGTRTDPKDLARVNRCIRSAFANLELRTLGEDLAWAEDPAPPRLDSLLWPIVRAAAGLLSSEEIQQVRQCEGEACTWLFLDRSRTRQRRWCSMASCGNRAKARRHYQRKREL